MVRDLGRISFLNNDGKSKESRRRKALLQPGSVFDAIIDYRPNRSLQTLREISPARVTFSDNPAKQSVIYFVCDFVYSLLNDYPADSLLFDYVENFIRSVDNSRRSVANAPIAFLVGLLPIVGIEPDMSTYFPGSMFDFSSGVFRISPSLSGKSLSAEESAYMPALLRMTSINMHIFKLSREGRNHILDTLLDYYTAHFGPLRQLPTLPILRSLFA